MAPLSSLLCPTLLITGVITYIGAALSHVGGTTAAALAMLSCVAIVAITMIGGIVGTSPGG